MSPPLDVLPPLDPQGRQKPQLGRVSALPGPVTPDYGDDRRLGTYAMAQGSFVAYYRVSTARQGKSGLGLEAQNRAVRDWLSGGRWTLRAEFTEIESGKVNSGPQLVQAIDLCRLTGSTLVIAKLDRLSRDAHFLLGLAKARVDFVAVDMPNANKLTVGIMALVAQQESEAISARTTAALAAAKARGTKLGGWKGGPKVDSSMGRAAQMRAADEFAARVAPTVTAMRRRGLSLRQIAAELTTGGYETVRGGEWTAATVSGILNRAAT